MHRWPTNERAPADSRRSALLLALGALALLAARQPCWAADSADGVQVIVHRSVASSEISRYKLRAIFGMRQPAWPNGELVRVFVLGDDHPLHRRFAKEQLGVFPYQLRRSWNNLVYSGLGQAPIEVHDEAEMVERVAATPGAIGYIRKGGHYGVDARILPVH